MITLILFNSLCILDDLVFKIDFAIFDGFWMRDKIVTENGVYFVVVSFT